MVYFALITAGGTGQRMDSATPKQFIRIGSKPIIVHTIEKFLKYKSEIEIILTLPSKYFEEWAQIKKEFLPDLNIKLVKGGETRFDSIKNALSAIQKQDGIIAIHDAVRPFVPVEVVKNCFEKAEESGSGIAAIELKDSIREIDQFQSYTRDRSKYRLMQTPQTFELKLIKEAYSHSKIQNFTDDAGVWENAGLKVNLVEGSRFNIKITYPEDIIMAEAILKS